MSIVVDVFNLDVLPAKCTVQVEMVQVDDAGMLVRFRAERPAGWLRRHREQSDWSGWFAHEGEPIELRWDTFWPPPPVTSSALD